MDKEWKIVLNMFKSVKRMLSPEERKLHESLMKVAMWDKHRESDNYGL